MWTDTAEFRNPNYHSHTDLPDTLNYLFMARTTTLLLSAIGVDATEYVDVLGTRIAPLFEQAAA